MYYNIYTEQKVCDETHFNPHTNKKEKLLRFSSDGKKYWETIFDENEKKSEFNVYEDGNLVLHEEFKNGKKHGKWFCINDDGSRCETEYLNGKKIKDCE